MPELAMVVLRDMAPMISDMKAEIQKCRKACDSVAATSSTHLSDVFQKHDLPGPCRTKEDFQTLNEALRNKDVRKDVVSNVT